MDFACYMNLDPDVQGFKELTIVKDAVKGTITLADQAGKGFSLADAQMVNFGNSDKDINFCSDNSAGYQ